MALTTVPQRSLDEEIEAAMVRIDILTDDLATFLQRLLLGTPAQRKNDSEVADLLKAKIACERALLAGLLAVAE